MLNSIINISGIKILTKENSKSIKGGDPEMDCFSQYDICDNMWPTNHGNFIKCMKKC